MSDETPSPEEGGALGRTGAAPYELSDYERDALGEIGNICMSNAAGVLGSLLGAEMQIGSPTVQLMTDAALRAEFKAPSAVVSVTYTEGLEGSCILVLSVPDAAIVADLMMGGQGAATDALDEMRSSAVTEAMNQMMGGAASAMAELMDREVHISVPGLEILDLADQGVGTIAGPGGLLVRISFPLHAEGVLDTTLMQIMPVGFARLLLDTVGKAPRGTSRDDGDDDRHLRPVPTATPPVAQPVTFPALDDGADVPGAGDIGLLLDVPLQVTVELGRTQLRIRNVLELVPGSIVELDKLAGEPVDVLVNGKQIARGEVVVIDEEFGVRITDVASQAKRLRGIAADETQ
jgi:flagellar motor switch protein FliN